MTTNKNKTTSSPTKEKKSKDFTGLVRALYIVAFAAMLSIGAYFFVMVSSPDVTQKVLGGFAILSGVYYFLKAIK